MLLEYAKKNHFPNPVFFVDDGCSGTNCDRPGFQRMLTEIEAEYRNIIVKNHCEITGLNQKDLGQHRTIPALRLKHRSGSCGTASALPK
ncbi:recombinase family protein, partial [Gemmiger sp.]|uniref:recombinase family protein n=1 Tax=Gemmiger sp. TaxID=2049027 RepID=UPI003A93F8C1